MAAVLIRLKNQLVKLLNGIVILTMALLVLDVLWGVFSRYVLGEQSSWTDQLAQVLLIWLVLFASAVAYGNREHLGLDYFVNNMDESTQAKMAFCGNLIVLIFAALVLVWGGLKLVVHTYELQQIMQALQVQKAYVYAAIPLSGFFFLIFSIESFFEKKEVNND
jgi:TRAP-type C4-dicarboxylate transport system permease small subunit